MTDDSKLLPDVCPKCGEDDMNVTPLQNHGAARDIIYDVSCCSCGFLWRETYTFTGWTPIPEKED